MAPDSSYSNLDKSFLQEIEMANQTGTPISDNDPIAQSLLKYRATQKATFESFTSGKQAVWEKIEEATKAGRKGNILSFITTSTATQKWAAAAVIVVAILLSVVYNQAFQEPLLLAEAGNTIETVTLSDGSNVTLRPHSKLFSLSEKENKQTYELQGEAFFDVTSNKNRTFSVRSEDGQISVLGTRFNLSTWGNELRVYLEEGSVRVESTTSQDSLILKPGESASIKKGQAPQMRNLSKETSTAWLNQNLIFNNRNVEDIIAELDLHFDITIEVPSAMLQQQLTGELSLESLPITLSDLGLVLGGTFTKTNSNSYLFNSN
ncbi:MAG: FecR domain-containing protein [Balneolaceae bacterium]